jgi:predicted secreted hydrolase
MVTGKRGIPFRRLAPGIAAAVLFSGAAGLGAGDFAYRLAVPGYHYQFPRDHFEHPEFRTEWWYYTGNVTDSAGRRFGFELVFFRQGERHAETNPSVWSLQDLYLAHAALTDVAGRRFLYHERLNRAGPGIAGASFADRRVWNGNWQARWSGEEQTMEATTADFQFHLVLDPVKPFVIQGENGLSQKAQGRGRASYYVSFPLLQATGEIRLGGASHTVRGTAWMDHEWFTEQLAADEAGWDWFSVQLDNHTELMLYRLRHKDGTTDPYSSGTFVDAQGAAHHLRREDFTLEPLERWGKYPVRWRIRVPSLGIDLFAKAVLNNQELQGRNGGPSYWEGAVDYTGSGRGVGYLEMTGYGEAVHL